MTFDLKSVFNMISWSASDVAKSEWFKWVTCNQEYAEFNPEWDNELKNDNYTSVKPIPRNVIQSYT